MPSAGRHPPRRVAEGSCQGKGQKSQVSHLSPEEPITRQFRDGKIDADEMLRLMADADRKPPRFAVAEDILGLDYDGTMIHDGWAPYDQFTDARHQQCLNHLLRRIAEALTRQGR